MSRSPPSPLEVLVRAVVEVGAALLVGYVAARAGVAGDLAEALRTSARGRARSRTGGPPVVWLQRVPREGAQS